MNKIKELLKNEKSKNILLAFVVGFIGLVVVGTGLSYGSVMWLKNSNDAGYLSDQSIGDLSFKNATMTYEDGITTLTVEVHNESGNEYSLKNIDVNITSDSDEVVTLYGYIGDKINANSMKVITASIDQELATTKKIEYVINR